MACYHPLKGFAVGDTAAGKVAYKITSYAVDHVELVSGNWIPVQYPERGSLAEAVVRSYIEIPCGKCIGCRLEYSRQWANRCMLELQYHDSAYFVTLTYDDDHVPISYYPDPETGEAQKCHTLCKRDFQLWMKRLRKAFPGDRIRFFAAGEYGSDTFRPHYHAIVFGLHLDDLTVYKQQRGYTYYNSASLQRTWPNGYVVVGKVTWETCAYTARYVMKKAQGILAEEYEILNIEPEFSLMSRKPGIARQYFDDHPDLYDYEFINVSTADGGRKFRPPRYYDKLFDIVDHDRMTEIKEVRKLKAIANTALRMEKTSLSYLEQLEVDEAAASDRLKKLRRSDV